MNNLRTIDSRNKLFFDTILEYEPFYEEMIQRSLEYNIQLTAEHFNNLQNITVVGLNTTRSCMFIPVGTTNETNLGYHFNWYNQNTKDLIYDHINRYNFIENNHVTRNSLDYYFEDTVQLNDENRNIIPYLISITNPSFNLIRFRINQNRNCHFYCMIDLGIQDNYDYEHDFADKLNTFANIMTLTEIN